MDNHPNQDGMACKGSFVLGTACMTCSRCRSVIGECFGDSKANVTMARVADAILARARAQKSENVGIRLTFSSETVIGGLRFDPGEYRITRLGPPKQEHDF